MLHEVPTKSWFWFCGPFTKSGNQSYCFVYDFVHVGFHVFYCASSKSKRSDADHILDRENPCKAKALLELSIAVSSFQKQWEFFFNISLFCCQLKPCVSYFGLGYSQKLNLILFVFDMVPLPPAFICFHWISVVGHLVCLLIFVRFLYFIFGFLSFDMELLTSWPEKQKKKYKNLFEPKKKEKNNSRGNAWSKCVIWL